MGSRRVIVTIDREKAGQVDDVVAQLKRDGFEVERLNSVLGVTHVIGRYDGDLKKLTSDGVAAEPERWMTEM